MAILVESQRIQVTKEQYTEALIKAWFLMFEEYPKKSQIAVIFAQTMIETGLKAFWNNNVGNVKYAPSKDPNDDIDKKYHMLKGTWEIINGKKVIFDPPHPATWFRSFDTLAEGIEDHFKFLAGKRWKLAWSAVIEGNPTDFARKLKMQGYYTAPVEDYTKGVVLYFNQFMSSPMFDALNDAIRQEAQRTDAIAPLDQTLKTAPLFPLIIENELPILDESDEVIENPSLWTKFKKLINLR